MRHSLSSELRFPRAPITHLHLGCGNERLAPIERLDCSDHHAGGQERPFHRIGRPILDDHRLDMADKWIEEVSRRGALCGHGQVHLTRQDFPCVANEAGVVEISDGRQEESRAKVVAMFDEVRQRVWKSPLRPLEGDLIAGIAFDNR